MNALDAIFQWLSQLKADHGVPGAAVGLAIGDQRFMRGICVANVETGDEFTPSTLFGIALLAHDGTLDLTVPVRNYLPTFRLADPDATIAVTLKPFMHISPEEGKVSSAAT